MFDKEELDKIQQQLSKEYQDGHASDSLVAISTLVNVVVVDWRQHYRFRKNWAVFVGIVSVGIILVAYFLITMTGLGKMSLNDSILWSLVGAGTLQSGAIVYITRNLFPEKETITSHFGDMMKAGLGGFRKR